MRKSGRFGGVDVFGFARGVVGGRAFRLAGGEGDDAALDVADGDHQPAAKARAAAGGVALAFAVKKQAAGKKCLGGEFFCFEQSLEQAAAVGRRPADFEFLGEREVEAAGFRPIFADEGAAVVGAQKGGVEMRGGGLVQVEQFLAHGLGFARTAIVLVFEGEAKTLREGLDRLLEAEVFLGLDEFENVAALAAAEAVIEVFARIHMERGRFFLGERAEALPFRAGFFQGHIGRDHVVKADAGAHIVNGAAFDFRHGSGRMRGCGRWEQRKDKAAMAPRRKTSEIC